MTFSEQLQVSRANLGVTQAQLAKEFGVTMRTYQFWETGQIEPGSLTQTGAYAKLTELENEKKITNQNKS